MTVAGTGAWRSMPPTATRSASATRSMPCSRVSEKPIEERAVGHGPHTAKSTGGTPCSLRSSPQASQSTPSSKGRTRPT